MDEPTRKDAERLSDDRIYSSDDVVIREDDRELDETEELDELGIPYL